MKKILLALGLMLAALPAGAHSTKPTDMVSINAINYDETGAIEKSNTVYSKPWSQVRVDAETLHWIDVRIARARAIVPQEKTFRIAHLVMIDGQISRVLLLSEYGTAIAAEQETGIICLTSTAGNGPLQFATKCVD